MVDPDFVPCEGEPLRDLTDPYRRAVADADATELSDEAAVAELSAIDAACVGGG